MNVKVLGIANSTSLWVQYQNRLTLVSVWNDSIRCEV
ncbi:hypothetical protein BV360_05450 [Pseudomonas syringae pv. actinidiae]|nr:hypothetical protein BV340_05356 [Pseudomonas syringae pv. actinidiae]OSN14395.1 hypothetical protein BV341_05472 [Pseudomonas syringae pv. actinidiae]OSN29370.1 hypothetical protein BV343_05265 [Pseudomonas syringae pv. actinidiae]OSN29431.1 hypothetical protein BV342_05505 [Pseudomonas syringae pv. actinidiae]OSN35422.1 hypothetical protein BV344_05286 [Pseudomonas syringae pv. actinidiae]